jgi:hypothetical protein
MTSSSDVFIRLASFAACLGLLHLVNEPVPAKELQPGDLPD